MDMKSANIWIEKIKEDCFLNGLEMNPKISLIVNNNGGWNAEINEDGMCLLDLNRENEMKVNGETINEALINLDLLCQNDIKENSFNV